MAAALTPDHSERYKTELQEGMQPAPLRGGIGNVIERRDLQYPEERWYSRLQHCEATPAVKTSEQPAWPFS